MKALPPYFACILACFHSLAQAQGPTLMSADFTVDSNSRLVFACSIDANPVSCFLDTGASYSSMQNSGMAKNYQPVTSTTITGVTDVQTQVPVVKVASTKLGTIVDNSLFLLLMPADSLDYFASIGSDILAGRTVYLDFEENSLRETEPLSADGASGKIFNPNGNCGSMVILSAGIAGVDTLAMLDTGAPVTLVDSSIVDAHPDQFVAQGQHMVNGVNGPVVNDGVYFVKSFRIGTVVLDNTLVIAQPNLSAVIPNGGVSIILGMNDISRANWTFDMQNRLWMAVGLADDMK